MENDASVGAGLCFGLVSALAVLVVGSRGDFMKTHDLSMNSCRYIRVAVFLLQRHRWKDSMLVEAAPPKANGVISYTDSAMLCESNV